LLAIRLEDSEAHRGPGWIIGEPRRNRFIESAREIRIVDAGGRCKHVLTHGVLEQIRGLLHPIRIGRGVVDHRVPALAFQCAELAVPVSNEPDDAGGQIGLAPSASEDRDTVPAFHGVSDQVWSNEPRATEHEDVECGATTWGRRWFD
jgi:hypothetical protein